MAEVIKGLFGVSILGWKTVVSTQTIRDCLVDVNYKPWFAATSTKFLTVSDIGYEVPPTMVPQPWFVASQTSQNCHAKQPLSYLEYG